MSVGLVAGICAVVVALGGAVWLRGALYAKRVTKQAVEAAERQAASEAASDAKAEAAEREGDEAKVEESVAVETEGLAARASEVVAELTTTEPDEDAKKAMEKIAALTGAGEGDA